MLLARLRLFGYLTSISVIEDFLFTKLNLINAAPYLAAFSYLDQKVSIEIISSPNKAHRIRAEFPHAVMEVLSFDKDEIIEWPLDIIGFDCYEIDTRWQFVLHCSEAEWIWQSEWPLVSSCA